MSFGQKNWKPQLIGVFWEHCEFFLEILLHLNHINLEG